MYIFWRFQRKTLFLLDVGGTYVRPVKGTSVVDALTPPHPSSQPTVPRRGTKPAPCELLKISLLLLLLCVACFSRCWSLGARRMEK